MPLINYPLPSVFGLPSKFQQWRTEQLQAIQATSQAQGRFTAHALPTGSGKSLAAMAVAQMMGWRVVYLTSTKGLQRQLEEDFGGSGGLVDIRGQGNYRCRLMNDDDFTGACDHGPCHAGYLCQYRFGGGCSYFDAVGRAKHARSVVTNYKYWVMVNKYAETVGVTKEGEPKGPPLGKFDLLVLDECHNAPDELSESLSFSIHKHETEGLLGMAAPWATENVDHWRDWADPAAVRAEALMIDLSNQVRFDHYSPARRAFKQIKDLKRKLDDLAECQGQWVANMKRTNEITFAPVWPSHYKHSLFLDVPRVMLLSATVRPKTADLLGIKSTELEFYEYDSSFPVNFRPVIHIPTVRMNNRTNDDELRLWLTRIDQIIKGRLDRKGIIHTVSYDRRNLVVKNSKYANCMISHDSSNTSSIVGLFKRAAPPAVLVSPSVSTGWDFPYDQCRYQIIGKLAFIDTRDKIAKARCAADDEYSPYIAAQELVQMCGRGMRSVDDFCESLIIDDNIRWFIKRYKHFFARWFLQSYSSVRTVPDPPRLK